jgi:error-prone DNA polymerase
MTAYVELRSHTCFSFSDGAVSPEALARRARRLGYTHLGITDTADLGALAKFSAEAMAPMKDPECTESASHTDETCEVCQRLVRPIVGVELNVDGHPAAFLARDQEGYCNIAALATMARVGQWEEWDKKRQAKRRGRPKVTWAQVAAHARGIHALTGPASGELASLIRTGRSREAAHRLTAWRDVFADRLAVEVQLHHTGGHEEALAAELIALAEEHGVPWVTTQDPRYIDDRGRLVHDLFTALRYDLTVAAGAERGVLHPNGEWRLKSPAEMAVLWRGREDGLHESVRIAEECTGFTLDWMRPPLPDFRKAKINAGHADRDDNEVLRTLTYEGALVRWREEGAGALTTAQTDQIDHELKIIGELGFAGFFLVMADAVRFARHRGILCQGRGSAANSVVAYCLAITAVDPVKHGLLFERFLSEARVDGKSEPPDIDVDFEHERREEVLDYMYDNYDRAHAAITGVTQMYRAPNAVQDAMRALGYPVEQALEISKRVHGFDPAESVSVAAEVAESHGVNLKDARGRALLTALEGFDGLARMHSTHVGGFVLSAAPLGNYLPVEQTTMGRTILQFDKDDLDLIGVPKFDFLGLGALRMVRLAFDCIEQTTGRKLEMYSVPEPDEKTYDLIQRGETIGTFQIESRAQINSILHTKPDHLYDIVVQVALIRPGPIQAAFVRPYTHRRLGEERVTYPHPDLEPILRRTQGIPIFQEQAMAIAMKLGGYSGGQADALRRTMGNIRKKGRLESALVGLKTAMLARAARGEIAELSQETAARICEDLLSFANYGFPESHAWSFALIAYATAYLKAHYATEFFLGLLNAQPMGFYPISTLVHDARRHGVVVRPPCLAEGSWDCTVVCHPEPPSPGHPEERSDVGCHPERSEGSAFMNAVPSDSERQQRDTKADPSRPSLALGGTRDDYSLRIGWRFVRGIDDKVIDTLKAAYEDRPFTSIADVVQRGKLDRGKVLAFAQAGAFGYWAPDRRHAAWEGLRAAGDVLPLAPATVGFHDPVPIDEQQLVFLDYHAVGMSIYGHPMASARAKLEAGGAIDSRGLLEARDKRIVTVGGLVTVRQRPATAGGTIFLLLEDEWGFMNIVVPQKLVGPNEEVVKRSTFVLVQGRVENDGASISVVGQRFKDLEVGPLTHRAHEFR